MFFGFIGVTRLWPPEFLGIFLECPDCGLLSFWGYFGVFWWWPPEFFWGYFGGTNLWSPVFFRIF